MAKRKIHSIKLAHGCYVNVHKDSEYGEYVVTAYLKGAVAGEYFTDDKQDALATAEKQAEWVDDRCGGVGAAESPKSKGAYGTPGKVSKDFLTAADLRILLKALRNEGIKPPKPGWEIKAFGGTIINHGTQSVSAKRKLGFDATGWQVINIDEAKVIAASPEGWY